jgi:hypothetical protein
VRGESLAGKPVLDATNPLSRSLELVSLSQGPQGGAGGGGGSGGGEGATSAAELFAAAWPHAVL